MVLIRALCALAVFVSSVAGGVGCGQSLFDANGDRQRDGGPGGGDGGDDGGGDDGSIPVPETCEAPCIADAAADFIDTTGAVWRYLDDRRNRVWVAMVPSGSAMMSMFLSNQIERCNPAAAACQALPGALLVTSAGMQSSADPAIELKSPATQTIQLAFRAHVPLGSPSHRIRLYRNSREDVLVTALAEPGKTASRAVFVDALVSDRFLIAVEPTASPGGPVALQFFARGPDASFPSVCQLAIPFPETGMTTPTIPNLCGPALQPMDDAAPSALFLEPGPFTGHGLAGNFSPTFYVRGAKPLVRGRAMTVQLWVRNDFAAQPQMWVFSDIDQSTGGGLGIQLRNDGSGVQLEASVPSGPDPKVYTGQSIPFTPDIWHFVRVIHENETVTICLDGRRQVSGPLAGPIPSNHPPYLGRNVIWPPPDAYLRGAIDDVRVFSAALPCDP
jgi:hypothetical protein